MDELPTQTVTRQVLCGQLVNRFTTEKPVSLLGITSRLLFPVSRRRTRAGVKCHWSMYLESS